MNNDLDLGDLVLIIENRKGTEHNYILSADDFHERFGSVYTMDALYQLLGSRNENTWGDTLHISANHTVSAALCGSLEKLQGFLHGKYNDYIEGEDGKVFLISKEMCSKECLKVLGNLGINVADYNHTGDYSYAKDADYRFKKGELVRNGSMQLRVVQVLPGNDVFFERIADGSYILAHGAYMYNQTPKGENPGESNTIRSVCWNAGDYYSDNLFEINFEAIKEDYYLTAPIQKGRKK